LQDPQGERTAGGAPGKLIGRLKAALGSSAGRPSLEREGRLQKAAGEADLDARRHAEEASVEERQAEVQRERTETELERRRLENEVSAQAREEQIEADRRAAEVQRGAAEQTADDLETKAREAERHAERIDPEGNAR
jgi:uncharacterized protein YjbJ (UPF0337 family)